MGPFLCFVTERCDQMHHELARTGCQVDRRVALDSRKLGVEVQSSAHLALVEAWEHARCLDVTVMERTSGESRILSAGPCATNAEVESRLEMLVRLIQEQS